MQMMSTVAFNTDLQSNSMESALSTEQCGTAWKLMNSLEFHQKNTPKDNTMQNCDTDKTFDSMSLYR